MCLKSDILNYESKIWNTCDILRGAGIKQSDYPAFMMPFFILRMIEGRMKTHITQLRDEEQFSFDDVTDELTEDGYAFNAYAAKQLFGEQDGFMGDLQTICSSDEGFEEKFAKYLEAWDEETKLILGISEAEQDYLDINKYIKSLSAKKVLYGYVSAWSEIDLSGYDASDLTTLEEHIKRKWADISASTSGEQYTPSDIIELISALTVHYTQQESKDSIKIYDMTCGGGNLIYGAADQAKRLNPELTVNTFGQEINDALYALAKIESRFRRESGQGSEHEIGYGCTLSNDTFQDREFDFVLANPPYGVDWKQAQKAVNADETGRFVNKGISTSDGQLLFMQHAVAKMNSTGKGIIVHNGSPMFTGDVNSAESQVRKWLLDNDWIEAWIQLPKEEFFNTQITTYLWVINKNKPASRKDKIVLINAADRFSKLKKSKGKKTNYMTQEDIDWVMDVFANPIESDEVKFVSKYDFYYNKQQLTLIEKSESGLTLLDHLNDKDKAKGLTKVNKPSLIKLETEDAAFEIHASDSGVVTKVSKGEDVIFDVSGGVEASKELLESIKAALPTNPSKVSVKAPHSALECDMSDYIPVVYENGHELGAGRIVHKLSIAKSKGEEFIKVVVELKAELTKDYEIIPYQPGEANDKAINEFMNQWVRKEYKLGENSVGAEVNFNKIFYKPVVLRSTLDIIADIKLLDVELAEIEKELW